MSQIPVQKTVFNKGQYSKVIDTQFSQLISSNQTEEELVFTVDNFFELYDQLFYQIPRDGETNSHQFILQKEAEYLGINLNQDDIQALLDEITSLRQQVIDTQTVINELTKATSNR
jgi:hypothetical protein